MGHKVKGYRRNAEYGKKTRRRGERGGWRGEVNPPGKDGWEKSGVGRSGKEYGKSEGLGNERLGRVEEVRKSEGYESNGRGRKGDGKKGYVVCGEYVKVVEKEGKRGEERREGRKGKLERRKKEEKRRGGEKAEEVERVEKKQEQRRAKGKQRKEEVKEEVEERKKSQLERKRERRGMRYMSEVGRKVTMERVNRSGLRKKRGRRKEVGVMRRGRVAQERLYREKSKKNEDGEKDERLVKRGERMEGGEAKGGAVEVATKEREKRRKKKERKGEVRREAMAVVVVRGGVMRMERRMVKRRIMKREKAGRDHMRVRRDWGKRRKQHGKKSKYGRVEAQETGVRSQGVASSGLVKRQGGYYGYRVRVKGPLNGSRRTKKKERGNGTVPESMKKGRIGTAEGVAKTSVGTRGVQVAYCYGRG